MGYQHGTLLKQEIRSGALPFYANPINGRRKNTSLKDRLFALYLHHEICGPAKKSQPQEMIDHMKGMADGSGLPFSVIFRAYHHPSVGLVLVPKLIKQLTKGFKKTGISLNACSSFAVKDDVTASKKLIIGRNMDYAGIESFPANQTVCFYHPYDGYKYVEITTAGLCSPTGMNEKGLVLCGHNLFLDSVQACGWGFLSMSTMILRKACNIEQAVSLIKSNKRGFCGALLLAESKTKKAVVVEFNSQQAAVRSMEQGNLVLTNIALTAEMQKVDFLHNLHINESAKTRYLRLQQLIHAHKGAIDPETAACFLGDHIHFTTGTERSVSGIIAAPNNINSVVFLPERFKFWVASGPVPASNNHYIGFDFWSIYEKNIDSRHTRRLKGYCFQHAYKLQAMNIYREAHILHEEKPYKKDRIKVLLFKALKTDNTEILFYHILCKMLIHEGNHKKALSVIQNTQEQKQSLNEETHSLLLLGICHDLLGRRRKALTCYQRILDLAKNRSTEQFAVNKLVFACAEKYIQRAFTKNNTTDRSVEVSFSQSSGME
ncbi:MAG: hypothetical protein JW822_14735 [Spirochaetales bacterium]|nr:hypothetical protein [Spirochaetales bacterium]